MHTLSTAVLILERATSVGAEVSQAVWMRASKMDALALRYRRAAKLLYLATAMRAVATAGTSEY